MYVGLQATLLTKCARAFVATLHIDDRYTNFVLARHCSAPYSIHRRFLSSVSVQMFNPVLSVNCILLLTPVIMTLIYTLHLGKAHSCFAAVRRSVRLTSLQRNINAYYYYYYYYYDDDECRPPSDKYTRQPPE